MARFLSDFSQVRSKIRIFVAYHGADMVLTAWGVVCKHAVCGGASLKQCHKTI